ncbi:hypothetical protein FJY90_02950 [Candidatus Gottesmanbacteria bacterium]|nr:hypothetical protein [Candidatus Gottesmanbacteria bacterium]
MQKKLFIFCSSFILVFLSSCQKVKAAADCQLRTDPVKLEAPLTRYKLKFDASKIPQELAKYPKGGDIKFSFPGLASCPRQITDENNPTMEIVYENILHRCGADLVAIGQHKVELIYEYSGGIELICNTTTYTITEQPSSCKAKATYTTGIGDVDSDWQIVISDIKLAPNYNGLDVVIGKESQSVPNPSFGTEIVPVPPSVKKAGTHACKIYAAKCTTDPDLGLSCSPGSSPIYITSFEIATRGATPRPTTTPLPTPTSPPFCFYPPCSLHNYCIGQCDICPGCPGYNPTPVAQPDLQPICDQLSTRFKQDCWNCINRTDGGGHIWTAIGCLPTNLSLLLKDYIFTFGIGITGGIAFLYFIYGAFLVLTSMGNAERIEEGKQIIVSALSGLLFIIFSIYLLRVIGVNILKLPGFE